jgi:hypothetical protein
MYRIPETSHIKNSPQKSIAALLHKKPASTGILRESFCAEEQPGHVHKKPKANIP